MTPSPSRSFPWKLLSALGVTAICLAFASFFLPRNTRFESSPTRVRPWAEEHFLKMTKPVRSPGSPTDPQYTARHGGSGPSKNPNYKVQVRVEPPATEYVPDYEVIEFDAADGFTVNSGSGAIRWLATKPYDVTPDYSGHPGSHVLAPFHPDGRPIRDTETGAIGLKKRDLESWGQELSGEFGTALKGSLELMGFANVQWKCQDVFDAATRVSVRQAAHHMPAKDGFCFRTSIAVLHDAPLLTVIDLAHGETRDFTIPITKGASVSHADFRFEVIDAIEGTVSSAGSEPSKSGKAREIGYGTGSSPGPAKSFSAIYQINPPSMTTAISVDALDAAGNLIENRGRFMEDAAPVSRFEAPLATATALRVRYRPHQTRLLLKMKSLPGVTAPNIAPADLFDVKAPQITFMDSLNMRRFIASGTQLKDITGSWSYDTPAAFPMTLTQVSPRQVAERYLALDQGRTIKVDPAAMTIEF
jgi:hypothetical protein